MELQENERAIETSNEEIMAAFSKLVQDLIGQCLCVFGIKREKSEEGLGTLPNL